MIIRTITEEEIIRDPTINCLYNVLLKACTPEQIHHGNGLVEQGRLPLTEFQIEIIGKHQTETFTLIGYIINHKTQINNF